MHQTEVPSRSQKHEQRACRLFPDGLQMQHACSPPLQNAAWLLQFIHLGNSPGFSLPQSSSFSFFFFFCLEDEMHRKKKISILLSLCSAVTTRCYPVSLIMYCLHCHINYGRIKQRESSLWLLMKGPRDSPPCAQLWHLCHFQLMWSRGTGRGST